MRKTTALAALGVAAIASLWLWVGIRLACWEGTLSFTASALCDWSWILPRPGALSFALGPATSLVASERSAVGAAS